MKKILLLFFLCTTVTAFAKAPLSIKNKPVYAGADFTLEALYYSVNDAAKDDTSITYPVVGFGAFYDMYYLRLGMNYTFNTDKGSINSDIDAIDGDSIDNSYKFLNIDAIGKYPMDFKSGKMWPAIGLQYSYNLEAQNEAGDDIEDSDLSDVYLLFGAGIDYPLKHNLILSSAVIFGWNLTPETVEDPPNNNDYMGLKFDLRIALGYSL